MPAQEISMNKAQQELFCAIIGLARAMESQEALPAPDAPNAMMEALAHLHNADEVLLADSLKRVRTEKLHLLPDCATCPHPCGRSDDYDFARLTEDGEEVTALKLELLRRICNLAEKLGTSFTQEDAEHLRDGMNQIGWGYRAESLKNVLEQYEG